MPVTLAQKTCTRNLHARRPMWYKFFFTSFLHAIEHSSIPAQKLSSTWLKPCNVIGWPVVIDTCAEVAVASTMFSAISRNCDPCTRRLSQVSGTSFLSVHWWNVKVEGLQWRCNSSSTTIFFKPFPFWQIACFSVITHWRHLSIFMSLNCECFVALRGWGAEFPSPATFTAHLMFPACQWGIT